MSLVFKAGTLEGLRDQIAMHVKQRAFNMAMQARSARKKAEIAQYQYTARILDMLGDDLAGSFVGEDAQPLAAQVTQAAREGE